MYAPHALFKAVRIPWNVIIYHQMAELQVNTFTGSFGSYHNLGFILEYTLGLNSFLQPHTTMNRIDSITPYPDFFLKILKCISGFSENENLFFSIFVIQSFQCFFELADLQFSFLFNDGFRLLN